eukprot:6483006-Amphidinium_carterae.1
MARQTSHVPYVPAIVKGEKDREGHVPYVPAIVKGKIGQKTCQTNRSCTLCSGNCEGRESQGLGFCPSPPIVKGLSLKMKKEKKKWKEQDENSQYYFEERKTCFRELGTQILE